MPSLARATLTAASHVLDAFEAGAFPEPHPLTRLASYEWEDGYATLDEDGGITVTIPTTHRPHSFRLCPVTGRIVPDRV